MGLMSLSNKVISFEKYSSKNIDEQELAKLGRMKVFNLAKEELGIEKLQEVIRYITKSDESAECMKVIINDQIQNFGHEFSTQLIITSILYGVYIAVKNDIGKER
ncbi:MAG: hypothetical protein K0S71_648 [Clostridia bacterium]|nr:hypothetical protein [Clostridia bacterium]